MNTIAVTTFSPRGYQLYGKRFVESFLKHWDIPLKVWVEEAIGRKHPRLEQRMLWCDPAYKRFLHEYDQDAFRGHDGFPNGQLIRFCHKVFAMTGDQGEEWDRLIWLDADVETIAPVNQDAIEELCPSDVDVCYLGRSHLKVGWPETGFLCFQGELGKHLLWNMRELYVSGQVVELPRNYWHDAAAFEVFRKKLKGRLKEFNLSATVRPEDGLHVWPHTLLARFMTHQKGPARKLASYGAAR